MENNTVDTQVVNEKTRKALKANFEMYERTLKETNEIMRAKLNEDGTKRYSEADIEEQLRTIRVAQEEIVEKYRFYGGDPDDLVKKTKAVKKKSASKIASIHETAKNVDMTVKKTEKKESAESTPALPRQKDIRTFIPEKGEYDPEAAFDVIPLPSNGECYPNKISHVSVAYLNAYDENMIVSPNLYRDGKILDYILQEKVLGNDIDVNDLTEGDREAIILFLRASGYGNEYPITVRDDRTGKPFETTFDLSTLKTKEFKLKGDENGYFDFTLPLCGKTVKFRFLTHKDTVALENQRELEDKLLRKNRIKDFVESMDMYIENDEDVESADRINIRKAIRQIEAWEEKIDEETALDYTHTLTDRLELSIVSIDGNSDREYITDFIHKMRAADSNALRRYIRDNEPGIDYNIEIERPEDLGGGSLKTFLQFNQLIFLNIS